MKKIEFNELIRGPDDTQVKNIRQEIGEVPERYENTLKVLQEWADCQEYFPKNFDKNILSVVLRGSHGKLEKSKRRLQRFFIVKTQFKDLVNLEQRFGDHNQHFVSNIGFVPLPRLTPQGHRVYTCYVKKPDLALYNADIYIASCMAIRYVLYCKETMISGDIIVIDTANVTAAHCARTLTPFAIKLVTYGQSIYPVRMCQIHFIHANSHVEKLVNFGKRFLKDKLKNRIAIDKGTAKLLEYVPKHVLPREYGGDEESIATLNDKWQQYINENREWFRYQYDDVVCTGTLPKDALKGTIDADLGAGAFRKLEID